MKKKSADSKKASKVVWIESLGKSARLLIVVPMTAVPSLNKALIDAAESVMLDRNPPDKINGKFSEVGQAIQDFQDEMDWAVDLLEDSKKKLQPFSATTIADPIYTTEPYVFRIEGIWKPTAEVRNIDDLAAKLKSEGFDPQIERYLG
jgi:hypothetical protein